MGSEQHTGTGELRVKAREEEEAERDALEHLTWDAQREARIRRRRVCERTSHRERVDLI